MGKKMKRTKRMIPWRRMAGVLLLSAASWALAGGGLEPVETQGAAGAAGVEEGAALQMPAPVQTAELVPVQKDAEENGWEQRLLAVAENAPYVSGVVLEGETQAAVSWKFYEDRDSLLAGYAGEKAAALQQSLDGCLPWFFLKMSLDEDMHAYDLYTALQWNDAEEGYVYEAYTMAGGKAYEIAKVSKEALETRRMIEAKKEIVVRDGYLYLFACGNVNDGNREAVAAQIRCLAGILASGDTSGWGLDEESLFWIDHTERVQTFADPQRQFTEKRAVDTNWPDEIMRYFALMTEARYQVRPAAELPELTVTFRLMEEEPEGGYEAYLLNGFCMDEPYRMEVRETESGRLLQEEQVSLNIDYIDTVRFRDVNGDGYADMEISYLTYFSGYDGRDVDYKIYWLWNPDKEMFERRRGRIQERTR